MYQEHYGLKRPPFSITPDTSLFYEGSQRGAALDALVYAIQRGEGIIKVVGEVGSGKTMLCRMLELRLSGIVDVVYIANPSLSPDNILHVIAYELGLDVTGESSRLEVMQKLQQYLLEKHADNRQVVVFVEEAQSMPLETLEEIRLLSNLETDHNKLLQMVLFGQPELDAKLAQPDIRQLKERITQAFYLDPFAPEDTLEYLNFRLRAVGYRGPDIFNGKTAKEVKKYSGGLTRRINILADKALMASYSEGKHAVTKHHVRTAAIDSDFVAKTSLRPLLWATGATSIILLALWIGTRLPHYYNEAAEARSANAGAGTAQPSDAETSLAAIAPAAGNPPEQVALRSQAQTGTAAAETPAAARAETAWPLLAERMDKTEQWLLRVADSYYSIQLFMASTVDPEAVEDFLRNAPEMLDLEKIYIYETTIDGSEMYSVLYDGFASRQTAWTVLQNLPAGLQTSRPYLRRVGSLRRDLVRNG